MLQLEEKRLALLAAGTYILLMVIMGLSSTHLFGKTNAEVSRLYPTPLTPAGYAFSIWGIIFLLQGAWVAITAVQVFGGNDSSNMLAAAGPYIMGCWVFEMLWQFAFARECMWLAQLLIMGSFASMGAALVEIYRIKQAQSLTGLDHLAQTMCAMNAGWLSVAVSAATMITAVAYGARPQATQGAGIALAAGCTLLACALVILKGDFAYGLTVVWGLTAVHVNQKERYPAVGTSTLICNIAILGACAFAALRMLVPAFRTATNYSILATPDGDE